VPPSPGRGWLIVALIWVAGIARTLVWQRDSIVATVEGISDLRLPSNERSASWLRRRRSITGMTPWAAIEGISVHRGFLGTDLRVRLTDGREASLGVQSMTRRWLDRVASSLERARDQSA
jgi:hypothetical protein